MVAVRKNAGLQQRTPNHAGSLAAMMRASPGIQQVSPASDKWPFSGLLYQHRHIHQALSASLITCDMLTPI
jgi:hypothetical protein